MFVLTKVHHSAGAVRQRLQIGGCLEVTASGCDADHPGQGSVQMEENISYHPTQQNPTGSFSSGDFPGLQINSWDSSSVAMSKAGQGSPAGRQGLSLGGDYRRCSGNRHPFTDGLAAPVHSFIWSVYGFCLF